jgi:hypothetical protein
MSFFLATFQHASVISAATSLCSHRSRLRHHRRPRSPSLETTSFPLDTALDTADVVDDDSDHAASSTSALNFSVPGAPTTHAQSLSTSMLNAGNATSDDDAAAQDGSGQQNISRPDSNTAAGM